MLFNWLCELPSDRYPIPSGLPGAFTSEGQPELRPMVEGGGDWQLVMHSLTAVPLPSKRCSEMCDFYAREKKAACKCRLGSNRAIFRRREWAAKLQGQRAPVRCSDTYPPTSPPGSLTPPVTNGYIINFWAF